MEIIKKNNGRKELDLAASFSLLLHRAWVIMIAAVIGGVLSLGYSYFIEAPSYEATVTLYVSNTAENAEVYNITTSDLSASMMLMATYAAVIKSEDTMDKVIELSGVRYKAKDLMEMINVTGIENTKILAVIAVSEDPDEAALLANTIAELAPDFPQAVETGSSIKVLTRARVPEVRSSPSYSKALLLGIVAGGFLAVMIIMLLAVFDTRIRKEEDLESMGYPLLGTIPVNSLTKRNKRGTLSDEHDCLIDPERTPYLYNLLREIDSKILYSMPGKGCRKLLITTPSSRTYRSEAAANMAMAFAREGHHIYLIDCNLENGEIADILKLDNKPGLTDFLSGQADMDKSIRSYRDNLNVITAGSVSPNPARLLDSDEMLHLLEKCGKGQDYMILNGCSFTENRSRHYNPDSKYIRSLSGVIIVVQRSISRKDILKEQIEALEVSGAKILGFVFISDKETWS